MTGIIDALWKQIESYVFITRGQFERALDGWEIEPVEIDGALAFAVLIRGPEFHFASFGTGNRITLAMIRERIRPLLDRYGYVTTHTPKGSARQHRFNRAFGFVETGETEHFISYRMDRPCQS